MSGYSRYHNDGTRPERRLKGWGCESSYIFMSKNLKLIRRVPKLLIISKNFKYHNTSLFWFVLSDNKKRDSLSMKSSNNCERQTERRVESESIPHLRT